MRCTCRQCDKSYLYNADVGYDRELCSSLCDGIERGVLKSKVKAKAALTALIVEWELAVTAVNKRIEDDWEPVTVARLNGMRDGMRKFISELKTLAEAL